MVEEQVAVVARSGAVLGSAPRSRMRRENLWHAATAVLVRRPSGLIYIHRRARSKDWSPSFHDAAAGGVVRAGEGVVDSARRELAEELGVSGVTLRPLLTAPYEDDRVRAVVSLYEVTWAGPVRHLDDEVAWGAWVTLGELRALMRVPCWPFVPDTRSLLARLAQQRVGDYADLGRDVGV